MTIRPAQPDDAATVVAMFHELHTELLQYRSPIIPSDKTSAWVRGCFEQAMEGNGVCLVVEDGDAVVGCTLAIRVDWPYEAVFNRSVVGLGTYVAPSHRKNGAASMLYETARNILTDAGHDSYYGGYLHDNENAARVVQHAGFIPTETSVVMPLVKE